MESNSKKCKKNFNELVSEELKKLYDAYVYSYGWKYCKTIIGYACVLSVEDYYKNFGLEDFVLSDKTKCYTLIK